MTTVIFNTPIDMLTDFKGYNWNQGGDAVSSATATTLSIANSDGTHDVWSGSFTYPSNVIFNGHNIANLSGTVTGYLHLDAGSNLLWSITDAKWNASNIYKYIKPIPNDATGLLSYLFGGADNITGSNGNDKLSGGLGADTLTGGLGDDTYIVDNKGDIVRESTDGGTDQVDSSISYALTDNVENLLLTGSSAINGTGNSLANTITGNSGKNILDGGAGTGADTLVGGGGNDTYIVHNSNDVIDATLGGIDLVKAYVSYVLANNNDKQENLTLTGGKVDINGTGNDSNNIITGNAGNNLLDGGKGSDTLIGGAGNDTYVVDLVTAGDIVTLQDTVTETANNGTDTIQLRGLSTNTIASTLTLSANLENLDSSATAASLLNLTGNAANNILTGNDANNILSGGAGADTLIGGLGNDTYIVDNKGDIVTESANGGTDLVNSSVNYVLTDNVENLTLTGTAAINGTGNSLDNFILGNKGNNIIDGGAGQDTLQGGAGNDTYLIDSGSDHAAAEITDSAGTADEVRFASTAKDDTLTLYAADTGIERVVIGTGSAASAVTTATTTLNVDASLIANSLTIIGNSGDNYLIGTSFSDVINGGAGDDYLEGGNGNDTLTGGNGDDNLEGGLGNDTLTGGNGDDLFIFNTAVGPNNIDTITDFTPGTDVTIGDKIVLDTAIFSALTKIGAGDLNPNQFTTGTAATTADQHLIYNSSTGALYYDDDGTGTDAQVQIATVGIHTHPALTITDFLLW